VIENLKIALRRQKKLIIIFLVSIVLPSVSLGVFGILAIRNEQFRLVKQRENEQRTLIDLLKAKVHARITTVEQDLRSIIRDPSFSASDGQAVAGLVQSRLIENPLVEQIFLLPREGDPVFPLLPGATRESASISSSFSGKEAQDVLRNARELEHVRLDYAGAAKLYGELFRKARTRNDQARMLNRTAGNLMKLGNHRLALAVYSRIAGNYPEAQTSSGVPLPLVARLGMVECYRSMDSMRRGAEQALEVYRYIVQNHAAMGEHVFRAHAALARDAVRETLSEAWQDSLEKNDYLVEVERLDRENDSILHEWHVVGEVKRECLPELRRRLTQSEAPTHDPVFYTKTIDTSDVLIAGVMIPRGPRNGFPTLLGVKLRNDYLEGRLIDELVKETAISERDTLTVSYLSGRMVYGGYVSTTSPAKTIGLMEENFPPWRFELVDRQAERAGIVNIYTSFYFWTNLTLIVVLVSGVLLVSRTVVHEMEVLKIKSDFVSSVSHEFKTPLTSIKALTERLLEGKVHQRAKIMEYVSIIAEDTKRLTRLVGNLLDFSKIEEGRREYELEETDTAAWLGETVESYRKEILRKGVQIRLRLADALPRVMIDKTAMAQAVRNLLDNAVKFSPGKKEIDVTAETDRGNVLIQVRDYGVGISKDEMGKIFEKFYQGKEAAQCPGRGTGLGLTLVKHTVEGHGGSVVVSSKGGEGSTFTLILPTEEQRTRGRYGEEDPDRRR
jgi:signal transduction histidine kinase